MKKYSILGLIIVLVTAVIVAMVYFAPTKKLLLPTQVSLLEEMANKARFGCTLVGPGSSNVPGYPVPVSPKMSHLRKAGKEFHLFFYSINPSYPESGKEPIIVSTNILLEFDLQGVSKCAPMAKTQPEKYGQRYSPEADRLSVDEVVQKRSELFAATQQVAKAYWSGATDETAKTLAQDFVHKFLFISEPGLRKHYYDLSPDFWQWIEKLTGVSIRENTTIITRDVKAGLSAVPNTEAACLRAAGKWQQVDLAGDQICNLPTTDAGALCTDSSGCQGICVGEHASGDTSGKCSVWRWVNCVNRIVNGQSEGQICVD